MRSESMYEGADQQDDAWTPPQRWCQGLASNKYGGIEDKGEEGKPYLGWTVAFNILIFSYLAS